MRYTRIVLIKFSFSFYNTPKKTKFLKPRQIEVNFTSDVFRFSFITPLIDQLWKIRKLFWISNITMWIHCVRFKIEELRVHKVVPLLSRGVVRGAMGAKPPWISEIYRIHGVFGPQRVLSPPPGKKTKCKPPWTNSWLRPWYCHSNLTFSICGT